MFVQEHLSGRPQFKSTNRHEPGLSYTQHTPLLCDFWRNTNKRWDP
jgi:hypothetical protein